MDRWTVRTLVIAAGAALVGAAGCGQSEAEATTPGAGVPAAEALEVPLAGGEERQHGKPTTDQASDPPDPERAEPTTEPRPSLRDSEGTRRPERGDPVTPGEDGVIDPTEDRVLMPPDALDEGIQQPDAQDQLERDRTEEGRPRLGGP